MSVFVIQHLGAFGFCNSELELLEKKVMKYYLENYCCKVSKTGRHRPRVAI